MFESIYQILAKIGFTHPLHPPATHLPAGLIIGGFVFALIAWIFNRKNLAQTARHCLFEFKMKLVLAGILLFLLLVAIIYAALSGTFTKILVAIYALCLVTVIGLGYFGGELVYGTKTDPVAETKGAADNGAALFKQNCSACHFTDSTATKVGPGLKGLFARDKFPISGEPVSDDSFRQILETPYSKMPPFGHLTDQQVNALLDYLKTL